MNSLSKFRLVEKEDEEIVLDKISVQKCKEECERSLLRKIWGIKSVNFSGVNSTFSLQWCHKGDLKKAQRKKKKRKRKEGLLNGKDLGIQWYKVYKQTHKIIFSSPAESKQTN